MKKVTPAKKASAKTSAPKKTDPRAASNRTDKTGSSGMGMTKGGVKARAQAAGDRANTNNALNSFGQEDMRRRGKTDKQIAAAMQTNVKKGRSAFNAVAKKYGVSGLKYQPDSTDLPSAIVKKKKK
jgi:hypothetical protein